MSLYGRVWNQPLLNYSQHAANQTFLAPIDTYGFKLARGWCLNNKRGFVSDRFTNFLSDDDIFAHLRVPAGNRSFYDPIA